MRSALTLACIAYSAALAPSPLLAQGFASADARIRTVAYVDGGTIDLETPPGGALSVLLAPGERIETVAVDAPDAFPVTVVPAADAFVVRSLGTSLQTGIEVRSDRHTYRFRVVSGPASNATLVARMTYGNLAPFGGLSPLPPVRLTASLANVTWKTAGDKALRPQKISDDGIHTYIEWTADQLIPAVFTIDALGHESMVNGYMRGNLFTIDRVYSRLVFRIDNKTADATRINKPIKRRRT